MRPCIVEKRFITVLINLLTRKVTLQSEKSRTGNPDIDLHASQPSSVSMKAHQR
jgi:hypothetical protein